MSLLLLLSSQKSVPVLVTRGLVARWSLGNGDAANYIDAQTVADLSGNDNTLQRGSTTGSDTNDWTIQTWGGLGDGSDDMGSATVALSSPYKTLITVVTPTAIPGTTRVISELRATTYDAVSAGKFLSSADYSGQKTLGPSSSFTANTPYFLASVRGASRFEQYVGLNKLSATVSGDPSSNSPYTVTLFRHSTGGNAFQGIIHEHMIYEVALTEAEIQQNYKHLKALYAGRGIDI